MSSNGGRSQPDAARQVNDLIRVISDAYLIGVGRTLVLVRHGEAERVAGGDRYDPRLSATGRAQAAAVASRLSEWTRPDGLALFASPRRRAAETAQAIADRIGVTVETEPGLAEVGEKGAPAAIRLADTDAGIARFEWDVPDRPFQPGAVAGVGATLERSSAELVIAVSHGGVINAYVSHLLGMNCEFFFLPDHTSLTIVRVLGKRVALDRLNDAGHLEGM
jgi:probable phosphoglycerate mutase